jgi:glycogen(starch) synthase
MRRRLSRLNRALRVEGFVALLGALDTEQLGALLATAHVVVVPSIEPEAFGLAAVEAALAGAPVVASNIGGIPEALADGEHALLFAPGDPAACARALANVLADPAATRLRVRAALERAKQFSLESYLDESEKLIARVAKRSSG